MGDSLENIDQSIDTQQQIVSIVDHKQFCNYLRKAILVLFDDEIGSSSKLEEALDENRANQECIKKFLSDSQVQTLYIQKSSTKGKLSNIGVFGTDIQDGVWWVIERRKMQIELSVGLWKSIRMCRIIDRFVYCYCWHLAKKVLSIFESI